MVAITVFYHELRMTVTVVGCMSFEFLSQVPYAKHMLTPSLASKIFSVTVVRHSILNPFPLPYFFALPFPEADNI